MRKSAVQQYLFSGKAYLFASFSLVSGCAAEIGDTRTTKNPDDPAADSVQEPAATAPYETSAGPLPPEPVPSAEELPVPAEVSVDEPDAGAETPALPATNEDSEEFLALAGNAATTTVAQVVYDHVGAPFRGSSPGQPWGKHELGLHGVPSNFNWAEGARPSMWLTPNGKKAVTTWGQVYESAAGSPVKNVRVQIRNHKLYAFAGGKWTLLESDSENLQGSNWRENFSGSAGKASSRVEPSSNGGGRSFVPRSGHNIHWWTSKWPRPAIPSGLAAFFVTAELRLIANTDANVNLANAQYVAGVSADYYASTTEAGSGPFPSLSISRHKRLTSQWKTFTAYIGQVKPTSVDQYRRDITSRALPPGVVADR